MKKLILGEPVIHYKAIYSNGSYNKIYFQTICGGYVLNEICFTPNLILSLAPWERWNFSVTINGLWSGR